MDTGRDPRTILNPLPRTLLHGLLIALAALVAIRAYDSLASSQSATDAAAGRAEGKRARAAGERHRPELPAGGALGLAGGALPDGTTAYDERFPGVANLDPGLRSALRRAAADAASAGLGLFIESGWRSPEYQDALLRDAVAQYGSAAEAARWVATAETSPHVAGDAVDVAPEAAAEWLAAHGARYGLCRIYANEPWHYELRPDAAASGCPAPYPDPTHDPRMQR
ncbi:MAG TPA: D-alanyl-D-alanine carboxypeptidase family protein [Solirubrobacterales bacterium]|jgi:hypothetical protein